MLKKIIVISILVASCGSGTKFSGASESESEHLDGADQVSTSQQNTTQKPSQPKNKKWWYASMH